MKDEVFIQSLLPLFTAAKPFFKQLILEAWKEAEDEKKQHTEALTRIATGTRIGGIELAEEVTGYSKSTIYNKKHKGEIPFECEGGKLIFSEAALLEWIHQGRPKKSRLTDSVDNFLGSRKRRVAA